MTIAPPRTDLLTSTELASGATLLEEARPVRVWLNDGGDPDKIDDLVDTVMATEHCKDRYLEMCDRLQRKHADLDISERHLIRVLLYHMVERSRT